MFFTDFFFYSFSFFQNPATPAAYGIQDLHNFVTLWLVIVFFPVLSMLYLITKEAFYSKRNKNYHVSLVEKRYLNAFFHNPKLEIVWTVLPAIILVIIAIPSFALLYAIDETIDPIKTVKAIGNQWFWEYEFFSKGKKNVISSYIIPTKDLVKGSPRLLDVDNPLILKSYQHIRILITSNDVLHSWAVPSLGIKLDAVPGRLNQTNLYLLRPGVFYGQCSELCGVGHGFMPIKVVSYSIFGFFKYFLDSQLDKNPENKNRRPFDYQLICGLLGTSLIIILFILDLMLCHEAEYNPRFLIFCSFIFSALINIGLHANLEVVLSYFLGIPSFLMKLNVGLKFFYLVNFCHSVELCIVFLFYMNWIPDNKEFIWCLVFIVIICELYKIFGHIVYAAQSRYSLLLTTSSNRERSISDFIHFNISQFYNNKIYKLNYYLEAIIYVLICIEFKEVYFDIFSKIFGFWGLGFLSKFTLIGLAKNLGLSYILLKIFGVFVALILVIFVLSLKFLPTRYIQRIYKLFPKKGIFFLLRCYDFLVEKRVVLFTHFCLRNSRNLSLFFLVIIGSSEGVVLLIFYIPLLLSLFLNIFAFLFIFTKMFYEQPPENLFFLLGVAMPSSSCVDIHGRCTDPRYSFLVWNKKENKWVYRFYLRYYFNKSSYNFLFMLNFNSIDFFSTSFFTVIISFINIKMLTPFW